MAIPQGDGSIVLSTKVDTKGIQKGIFQIKQGVKKATVIIGALGTSIGYILKLSTSAYADFEQLIGGVETLFKKSSDKVVEYANKAYKTAGISANEYMQIVTSFSASLLSSLGGDTEKAADIANQALIDMSDNANKMGTAMESIQNAYQGFAKQNYTMLDNLKLGYGGTKTEMQRLLKDAQDLTGVEYDIENLSDVYSAIHAIQNQLGITGTTALEAEKTISGSANTMKAAWKNVLTYISGGGDLDKATEELVDSIEKYFTNILPVVEKALLGVGTVIEKVAPKLVKTVANAFIKALPQLISAVIQMIKGLFVGIKLALVELLSGKTNKIIEEQSENIKESAKNQEKLTNNIKKTNAELNKSLAGFDDIQILTSQMDDDTSGTFNTSTQDIVDSFVSDTESNTSSVIDETDKRFTELVGKVSKWLIALGCVLLVTGNLVWGVGLIIAGAIGSEYAEAQIGDGSSLKELLDTITTALIIAGTVAIIIGLLLCMAQAWGVGIKMIITGSIAIAGSVAVNWDAISKALKGPLGILVAIVSESLLILGVILCVSGVGIPIGIALILTGVAGLATVVAVNWDAIVDKVKSVVNSVLEWIKTYGLLVLGIILCLTVAGIPFGIALIIKWAKEGAEKGTPLATAIVDKVKSVVNSVLEWIKTYGLLVLGIILCLTVAGIPFGIALIIKWAKEGAEKGTPLATAIVDKVKEVWKSVKAFWDKSIAPIFTTQYWLNLAKKCGNGLISGFELAINGIITMFEKMLNWIVDGINKIGFDVPDWLGGGHFGFNLERVSFNRVSIPRLAKGGIVPRSILANIGENGKEAVLPLERNTEWMDLLADKIASRGGNGNIVREEHYYLSQTELMNIIYKLAKQGEQENGKDLLRSW